MPQVPERLRHWAALIRRVSGDYARIHGRRPAIFRPRRFTEKMQWRKLFELDPRFVILSDKLAVRDFVAARVGAEYLIPLLWWGTDPWLIPFASLAPPYVLKGTHAAGQTLAVHDLANLDMAAMRETASRWLLYCHGSAACEPGYVNVPRGLMVEQMLFGPEGRPPIEYKLFTFGGRVRVILSLVVAEDRIAREAAFHTPDWTPLGWSMPDVKAQTAPLPRPATLQAMIDLSERLGAGFSHLRVDLYDCAEGVRVGELTLYTWGGLQPYRPAGTDRVFGDFWPLPNAALRAAWTMLRHDHVIPSPSRTR